MRHRENLSPILTSVPSREGSVAEVEALQPLTCCQLLLLINLQVQQEEKIINTETAEAAMICHLLECGWSFV